MKDRILAIDPSGAFYEGKGTSGVCYYNAVTDDILHTDCIFAYKFDKPTEYWKEHKRFIEWAHEQTPGQLAVVMEDYLIYAARADSHINSHMETSQLLGYLKMACEELGIPVHMQKASDVKMRWSNHILLHKGILFQQGRHFAVMTATGPRAVCIHEVDAVRHAIHFAKFRNQ